MAFGQEMLQTTDVGILRAKFYRPLAFSYLGNRFFGFFNGGIDGCVFVWPVYSVKALSQLGNVVAFDGIDGNAGYLGIPYLLRFAAVIVLGGK